MQFNVLQELRQPLGGDSIYEIDEPHVRLDDWELKGVSGSLNLLRTDRGLLASLKVHATAREGCARCLVEADCPVELEFDEEFIAMVDPHTGARMRVNEDEDEFRIGPDFVLDLREPMRQYGLMAEPVKPLCRPDCAGLCPMCGANLNEEDCGCALAADGRLSVLAGIDLSDEKGN